MTNLYSKSKIYKIVNDVNDYIYIGSTVERLSIRMSKIRFDKKRKNSHISQHTLKYGPENFHIILIEEYPCTNKEQL